MVGEIVAKNRKHSISEHGRGLPSWQEMENNQICCFEFVFFKEQDDKQFFRRKVVITNWEMLTNETKHLHNTVALVFDYTN